MAYISNYIFSTVIATTQMSCEAILFNFVKSLITHPQPLAEAGQALQERSF